MSHKRFVSHLYRWLIRLYPAEFRKRYGSEMHLVFEDRARDASRRRLATLGHLTSELSGTFSRLRSRSTFPLAPKFYDAEPPDTIKKGETL